MRKVSIATAVLLATLGLPGPAPAAERCDALTARADKALSQSNFVRLKTIYGEAKAGKAGCSSTAVYCLGRRIARAHVDAFYRRAGADEALESLKTFLYDGTTYGTVWQLAFALAEVEEAGDEEDTGRYDRSARHYQDAVNDIKNVEQYGALCPGEAELLPSIDQARLILARQSTASLLSTGLVQPPKLRNGDYGGIFVGSLRGVRPKSRPIPINFEFGKDVLDTKGDAAVKVLLSFLKRKKYDAIYLSGHTDTVGSNANNCGLAKRRLQTVATRLKEGGFGGTVHLKTFGEHVPFVSDDPGRYSDDERRALDRRVELQLDASQMTAWGKPCGS